MPEFGTPLFKHTTRIISSLVVIVNIFRTFFRFMKFCLNSRLNYMYFRKLIIYCFEIPRKRPNERSECDMEQSTY